ncbi:hypothetical protein D0Z07_3856 [Hyphodiscus hymeniophilus]|uniref:Uncharacterized protein n=1 Tax=Hyphodiscus hymeniophilus TaxID=353542 RepID=A0A9P6VM18_9HELO|nr:hypothetical protein D0Z07_3856 [Hyphodiscus hymeniophilus]
MPQRTTLQAIHSPKVVHESPSSSDMFRNDLQKPGGLLTSRGGLSLPAEICLKIVEDVVSADPKVGSWALKALSKTVSTKEGTKKLYPGTLLPSWPRNTHIPAHSYSWLCEVRCREYTNESLVRHEATGMTPSSDGSMSLDLPLPANVSEPELSLRLERFKKDALQLLYGIGDSTAAVPDADIHAVRAAQVSYLESLATTQLAVLGVMSRVLGLAYFRSSKFKHPKKTSDSLRERWIVFEDRILRYGPFFARAAVAQVPREIYEWSNEVIYDALADMEAFETGSVQGYASLQSVLWKLFCARTECHVFDSWEEAREMVEVEMMSYKV